MKKLRIAGISLAVLFVLAIFALGLDARIVNSTINKPSRACQIDLDCKDYFWKDFQTLLDGEPCVNKKWNFYNPLIAHVLALSPGDPYFPYGRCICKENSCKLRRIQEMSDPAECELVLESMVAKIEFKSNEEELEIKDRILNNCRRRIEVLPRTSES